MSTAGDKFSSSEEINLLIMCLIYSLGKSVILAVSFCDDATNLVVVNGLILFNSIFS